MLNFQPRQFEVPESKLTTHLNSLENVLIQVKRETTKRFLYYAKNVYNEEKGSEVTHS